MRDSWILVLQKTGINAICHIYYLFETLLVPSWTLFKSVFVELEDVPDL